MMDTRTARLKSTQQAVPPPAGTLLAAVPIETVRDPSDPKIVLITHRQGSATSAEELMDRKVKWAMKAGYQVLTRNIPARFAPHNAIIRISEQGTEDQNRDYLATIAVEAPTTDDSGEQVALDGG
jgi:hypothetical protein